jgi:wobble nucleotide-excising tRNase
MKHIFPLIVLLLVGCSISYTKKVNIEFSQETKASLEEYLTSNQVNFNPNQLYSLKDIQTFAAFNDEDKLNLPEILFFNANGEQVKNKFNERECTNILNDYQKINDLAIDEKAYKFTEQVNQFRPFNQSKLAENQVSVVIFYAKFVDNIKKVNQQSFEWYQEISSIAKEDVNILLVSLDVMEEWNLSEATLESLGIE